MSYALNLITGPVNEPITLAQAKTYIRLDADVTNDDADITGFIKHAREYVEAYCHRVLISQTWEVVYSCEQEMTILPLGQLTAVNSVVVVQENDDQDTQSTDLYHTTLKTDNGRVWLKNSSTWSTTEREFDNFIIQFVAGWANAAAVPQKFITAIKKIVAYMDANREFNDEDVYLLIQQSGCGKLYT